MVSVCCAVGCTYRHKKGSIGLYRFPQNKSRRLAWIRAIKRKNWEPSIHSRICGKHFQTGKPSKDENHPDYIPNVFIFSRPAHSAVLYERRKQNLKNRKQNVEEKESVSTQLFFQNISDEETVDAEIEQAEEQPEAVETLPEPMEIQERIEEVSKDDEIKALKMENDFLRAEKWQLQKEIQMLHPTKSITTDKDNLLLHTGIPKIEIFLWISDVIKDDIPEHCTLDRETQLLIVLMRLKLNFLNMYLAGKFNVSKSTIARIFDRLIPVLGEFMKSLIQWPDRKKTKKNLPQCFSEMKEYKKTRCIIDCTEVKMEKPNKQTSQSQTWSDYKSAHTLKFLVAISPTGFICFVSEAWGGRASDKEITLNCDFLNFIEHGDLVLADRGFQLGDIFTSKGAKLVVPSFTRGKTQLSQAEVNYSKKVSNVRIHVERVIRQIKRFRLLQSVIPLTFIKYMDNAIIICAALSNLTPSIISNNSVEKD